MRYPDLSYTNKLKAEVLIINRAVQNFKRTIDGVGLQPTIVQNSVANRADSFLGN